MTSLCTTPCNQKVENIVSFQVLLLIKIPIDKKSVHKFPSIMSNHNFIIFTVKEINFKIVQMS